MMNVKDLIVALEKAPSEAIVVGAWEGQRIIVKSVEIVTDSETFVTPFVELDVDNYDGKELPSLNK